MMEFNPFYQKNATKYYDVSDRHESSKKVFFNGNKEFPDVPIFLIAATVAATNLLNYF